MFEWHDNISIDYGDGLVFYLPDDAQAFDKKFSVVNERLKKKMDALKENDIAGKLNAYLDAIDEMLGEDATDRLFKNHAMSSVNIVSAYLYIPESVKAFYKANAERINRATAKEQSSRIVISPEARAVADQAAMNPPTAAGLALAAAKNQQQTPRKGKNRL